MNNITEIALKHLNMNAIFSSSSGENLKSIISNGHCKITAVSKGDILLSPNSNERKIIIIITGSADVYSSKKGEGVMLRKLEIGEMSGVSNLFADSDFESYIIAHEKSEVLEISVDGIKYLIENDRDFTYSYINFLSDRICFLNKKKVGRLWLPT